MNRSTATWLVLLSAWTLAGAAEQNTDTDADMTEEEIAEAMADIEIALNNLIGPSAFCTSYTDNGERRIYLTGVFAVDLAAWRNMEEDRPATEREVMGRFEHEYAAWLEPRYKECGGIRRTVDCSAQEATPPRGVCRTSRTSASWATV